MLEKQPNHETIFLSIADKSLNAMKTKAQEMNIKGVGLVAFYDSEKENWISKMSIMDALKNDTVNFLSVAYSKAGEMMDTLQNSGTTDRVPLLGEYNFLGGVIEKTGNDYVLAVFSGATGEEDTIVAALGLKTILNTLKKSVQI